MSTSMQVSPLGITSIALQIRL